MSEDPQNNPTAQSPEQPTPGSAGSNEDNARSSMQFENPSALEVIQSLINPEID